MLILVDTTSILLHSTCTNQIAKLNPLFSSSNMWTTVWTHGGVLLSTHGCVQPLLAIDDIIRDGQPQQPSPTRQ